MDEETEKEIKAITDFCLSCVGDKATVKACTDYECALYGWRNG